MKATEINNVEGAPLSSYFVMPTLEQESNSLDSIPIQINSFEELFNCNEQCLIIKGIEEIGKTTLLKMIFKYCIEHGLYPIYVNLYNAGNTKLDRLLQRVFSRSL